MQRALRLCNPLFELIAPLRMLDSSMSEQIKQRLRIVYTRDATLKYIGHLDTARTWQRILRRADLPLAYSEGFNPQPKITFAAALPLGCTSEHEVMDVVLDRACDLIEAAQNLKRALPPGMQLRSIEEAPLRDPALQVQVVASEYSVPLEESISIDAIADRVQAITEAVEVNRERRGRVYNLRPLIQALSIERDANDRPLIRMRLQTTNTGNGRPDEVLEAIGLNPNEVRIHRTQLFFLDKTA
jgi:radical SAM-linked protein